MGFILSSERVKEVEKNVIDNIGIPASVLMERAAESIYRAIIDKLDNNFKKILIVCGTGNNGADGLAVARLLAEGGYCSYIYEINGIKSELNKKQKDILLSINEEFGDFVFFVDDINDEYDVIIDAIFGIGINRNLDDNLVKLISSLNDKNALKVAVDIPSGLNSTTGEFYNTCFKSDITVCVGALKTGLFLKNGPDVSGDVVFSDIGFWYKPDLKEDYLYIDDEMINSIKILREKSAHKGTYGKTLILAGSKDMYGACYLCAKAALKSGAGMVKVITHENNRYTLQKELPEGLYQFYEDGIDKEVVTDALKWADTVVLGPGLSKDDNAHTLVECVVTSEALSNKIFILDADALNILSENKYLLLSLLENVKKNAIKCIMTPHKMELKRITDSFCDEMEPSLVLNYLVNNNILVIEKDCKTRIIGKDSKYINMSGNDGMATAGSGDVLSGILGGLLFRLLPNNDLTKSAAVCVWIHGASGDIYAADNNNITLSAKDLLDMLPKALDFLT